MGCNGGNMTDKDTKRLLLIIIKLLTGAEGLDNDDLAFIDILDKRINMKLYEDIPCSIKDLEAMNVKHE